MTASNMQVHRVLAEHPFSCTTQIRNEVYNKSWRATHAQSGMVGIGPEVGEQEWFPARFNAASLRLNGHKHCLDLLQRLRIVGAHNPTLLRNVVFVEDPEV